MATTFVYANQAQSMLFGFLAVARNKADIKQ